jgi:DNA-binding MarR family transcriptional regulator
MTETEPALHPGVLMFIAVRHMETRLLAALADAGHECTLAQARVAARIGPEGSRLTDLAEQAQVTKQTAGFLVDQLEKAGYVERVPDPADARAKLVRFAPRGLEVIACARTVEAEIAAEWEAHLGPERMQALREALTSLREIADPYTD